MRRNSSLGGDDTMSQTLSPEMKQLLDGPNFAHLSTLMPDGSPQNAPVWVGREGDRILVCTGEKSLKARNTRRDARIALSIVDFEDPYRELQLRGRIVERRPDPVLTFMDPISLKYTGKPFPMRQPEGRVALVIDVEKARYAKLPFEHTPLRPKGESAWTRATVHVRYIVDDVEAAVAFYTTHLGFTLISKTLPAFADVSRGGLRLLLSGRTSSAGRPMPDGRQPVAGGWNRIHLIVDNLPAEVERLRNAGVRFRNDIVTGPGGSQILLDDPAGNPVELFQPRHP